MVEDEGLVSWRMNGWRMDDDGGWRMEYKGMRRMLEMKDEIMGDGR